MIVSTDRKHDYFSRPLDATEVLPTSDSSAPRCDGLPPAAPAVHHRAHRDALGLHLAKLIDRLVIAENGEPETLDIGAARIVVRKSS